ncbi:unnamed protein product [Withania somnifera]
MDVEADWEMLLDSNRASDSEALTPGPGLDETGVLIQPNYFCIDSQIKYMSTEEEDSEVSDNPSWIDPASENQFTINTSGQFLSDSGSETREFEGNSELGFEGIEEITSENSHLQHDSGSERSETRKFSAIEEIISENLEDGSVEEEKQENVEGEKKIVEVEKKRSIVWWKVPIELVKYCAFRIGPAWTFSVAAAVMAFVILGRRLYKMKKKTKALDLKVTLDHKNVSQFTSRAARLNEAFSIVKRVPVIRPQLPAAGVTMWPVMSLR